MSSVGITFQNENKNSTTKWGLVNLQRPYTPDEEDFISEYIEQSKKLGALQYYINRTGESEGIEPRGVSADSIITFRTELRNIDDFLINNFNYLYLLSNSVANYIINQIYIADKKINELEMRSRIMRSDYPSQYVPGTKFNIPKMGDDMKRGKKGEQCPGKFLHPGYSHYYTDTNYYQSNQRGKKVYSELHCTENCAPTREVFATQLTFLINEKKPDEVIKQIERCIRMRQKDIDDFAAKGSKDNGEHAHEIKRMIKLRNDILHIGIENIRTILWDENSKNFGIVRNPQAGGKRRQTRKTSQKKRKQTRRSRA